MEQKLMNAMRNDCRQSCNNGERLEALKGQSILVTGGTGFVGKWIAETVAYLNAEHDFGISLHLLARNTTNFQNEVPHLAKLPFIYLIDQDVRNVSDLPEDVSWVIHAAASPDNREHSTEPLRTIDTIYRGTAALLDACMRLPNLNKFVYLSSNNIYGNTQEDKQKISENDMGLLSCNTVHASYSEAKRLAETVCASYRSQQRLPIVILRPFAFLGPYQGLEKPWALNNFIRDGILGSPIRILGDENTVRSFLYASDMAYWILAVLAGAINNYTYNLGSDDAVTLKNLAEKIASVFHNKPEIIVKSSRDFQQTSKVSVPDISSIVKDFGVRQTVDFDTALLKTINWYQSVNNKNSANV